jgi:hypothetical protein
MARRHSVGKGHAHVVDPRHAVYAALWRDRRYQRLQKAKDLAISKHVRFKNEREAYGQHSDEELRKADRAATRSVHRMQDYEDEALRKAGLKP